MNRTQLPINEIKVLDRQRTDMGDLDRLAQSIVRYGLICPITVNQNKVLVAGGRRLAACKLLGYQAVDVVFKETLSEDDISEMELEENVRRKDMRWQEHCLAIANVHTRRMQAGALVGKSWTQSMTAELLGVSSGNVNYCIEIARNLADASSPMWACESFREAWRLRLQMEEDCLLAEIRRREQEATATPEQKVEQGAVVAEARRIETSEDLEKQFARERYLTNPLNPPEEFDEYWEEHKAMVKQRAAQAQSTIYLSNMLHYGDCIEFMLQAEHHEAFDHIITDIPYGIEMDMLEGAGHTNVALVADEHDVGENEELMAKFFPAAFYCTTPTAFVITWCDQAQWQYMYDLALKAGFNVQRWPFVWVKTHSCANAAPQYNFTKNFEIAMICRKPSATLVSPQPGCIIQASNVEVRQELRHPFAKPYEVWNALIGAVSIEGQLILEPFAGAGSCVIAALQAKRRVVAVEKKLEHYNNLLENVKTRHFLKQNPNSVFA